MSFGSCIFHCLGSDRSLFEDLLSHLGDVPHPAACFAAKPQELFHQPPLLQSIRRLGGVAPAKANADGPGQQAEAQAAAGFGVVGHRMKDINWVYPVYPIRCNSG